MSSQPRHQTEEELKTAIVLLTCVADCSDSDVFQDWHQSLQSSIHLLINTVDLLQKQTAVDKVSMIGGA